MSWAYSNGSEMMRIELRNNKYMWCVLIVDDDVYYSQSFLLIGFRDKDYYMHRVHGIDSNYSLSITHDNWQVHNWNSS